MSKFFCLLKNNDSYVVSKIKTPNSVAISLDKESIVHCDEESVSFIDWFKRKREYLRHFSKLKPRTPNYGLNFLFNFLFIAICVLFFHKINDFYTVSLLTFAVLSGLFLLKVIVSSFQIRRLMSFFNEKMSVFTIMFCGLLSLIIYPLVRITVLFPKR
jgi:uncharacterized protein YqhQ